MKSLTIIVSAVLACVMLNPMPGIAAESSVSEPTEQAQPKEPKDECLLYLVQCDIRAHSIQDKIEKLHEEIAKGTKVYTPEELRILKEKLNDANRTLDFLLDK